jgi:magnesium-transporting ATPase (P-type)
VLFAAAVHDHGERRLAAAAAGYRRVLAAVPTHAAARNNLANVLADQGCPVRALEEARAALALTAPEDPLRAAVAGTVADLQRAVAAGSPAAAEDACS